MIGSVMAVAVAVLISTISTCVAYESFAAELCKAKYGPFTLDVDPNDTTVRYPPSAFEYVDDWKYTKGVAPPNPNFLVACECGRFCSGATCGCLNRSQEARSARFEEDRFTQFAYNGAGRLRHLAGGRATTLAKAPSEVDHIYECNDKCLCPSSCPNRVAQNGPKVPLRLKFIDRYKGWGVFAVGQIPAGTYVGEYVGEVLNAEESCRRENMYRAGRLSSYIFDIDFCKHGQHDLLSIDSFRAGNITRFINHSCDPNLVCRPVWTNSHSNRDHRLAFFATRTIEADEELAFNYKPQKHKRRRAAPDSGSSSQTASRNDYRYEISFECRCGARDCCKVVWDS